MSPMFPGSVVVAGAAMLCVFVPQRSGAQSIASVGLSTPTSVCAQDITVRVNLAAPAPAGGVAVQISSSLPATFALPGVLTIPSGATSGQLTARCTPSPQAVAVTVSATAGGSTQTSTLNVFAPTLDRVSTKPNENSARVVTSYTGAVALAGPAPAGGVIVTLSHDQPAFATVPTSVTVPAGATSTNFTVSDLKSVSQSTTLTITATGLGATRTTNVVLAPPVLTSLLLEQLNNVGGPSRYVPVDTISSSVTTHAQLRLATPAGANGLVVNLVSSNPAAVTVPSTVTIPPHDSVSRFPVTSTALSQTTSATLSASVGTVTKTATVVVTRVTLSSVSVNPFRFVGGQSVEGTVTSDRAAPAGGVLVKLESSNVNAVLVPPTVTIPAGARAASFTASSFAVTAPTQVTINATFGNAAKSVVVSLATEGITGLTTSIASVRGGTGLTGRLEALPGLDG